MARVLIIDDDVSVLLGYRGILRAAGHEVVTAALGEDGYLAAQRDQFDVVLCDQRLPDRPGIEVVSLIHKSCPRSRIVVVTGWGTPELIVEARLAGATTYAVKPLTSDDLVAVVDDALRLPATEHIVDPNLIGYAARRWTDLIIRGIFLPNDPSTVLLWCRDIAIARSTLQHRCDAVHVTPKSSLDLVRLLRVVVHHAGEPWELQSWLDIADDRTARALMNRACLSGDYPRVPNVESFLSRQRLIVRPKLTEALRLRLLRVVPGADPFGHLRL